MVSSRKDRDAIAERVKQLRLALGYENPTPFARFLGIGTNTLSNYETGLRRPELEQAMLLVRKTGVTLDWLYYGERAGLPHRLAVQLDSVAEAARERDAG